MATVWKTTIDGMLYATDPGSSGTTGTSILAGQNAAGSTTQTKGFFGISASAGPPTGAVADIPSGYVALHFDTANNRLYIWTGSAWHYIAITA